MRFQFKALTISCTSLERSRSFYGEVLGATGTSEDLGCPWYDLGGLKITLMPNAAKASPAEFPDHAMPILWLEVDDLQAAEAHFRKHGVPILDLHEDQFMLIADPDGLVLEIWQRDDAGE